MATADIPEESRRLYQLLQHNVDEQILTTGFVPPTDCGLEGSQTNGSPPDKNEQSAETARTSEPAWRCSGKQRDLILKLVDEHSLDKNDIETLATDRFGKGVRHLNKVEASGLIDEPLDTYGGGSRQGNGRNNSAYGGGHNGRRAA